MQENSGERIMFEKIKAKLIFGKLLSRPNINKAYAMVGPEDSWYNTIKKVHESLDEIKKLPHEVLEVTSSDSKILRGIYYPAAEKSDRTVICIHGYSSHAEREWAFPGLFYHSLGFNVLIPYQRAHGLSEGDKITFGMLEFLCGAWIRLWSR
jgi:pimeloyl-ACP methyl ester carboxylesterase